MRPFTDVNVPIAILTIDSPSPRVGIVRTLFAPIIRGVRTCPSIGTSLGSMMLQAVPRPPITHSSSILVAIQEENVVRKLSRRVARLFETCMYRGPGLFGDIGRVEKARESSLAGLGRSFVICWTSLSVAAVRTILDGNDIILKSARTVIKWSGGSDGTDGRPLLSHVQIIDQMLEETWDCLLKLCRALPSEVNLKGEQVIAILRNQESHMYELERLNTEVMFGRMHYLDDEIFTSQDMQDSHGHELIRRLKLRFILPAQQAKGYSRGRDAEGWQETLKSLKAIETEQGPHSALYTSTFMAITSDWSKCKDSTGTPDSEDHSQISSHHLTSAPLSKFPYLANELLALLGNMVEGKTGAHIDEAVIRREPLFPSDPSSICDA
ncbi:hypothetical protein BJV74DRAFT_794280 [Russula compacta]|nr:hypothetical protein BJV74DRAFT_794280 [Russula compacta]